MTEKIRSSEDILQDIAREEKNISQAAQQIGERIKEKLDWTAYVKESPYWALGAAAALGYFGSRMFATRTPPLERIMVSIAEEVRESMNVLPAGPSLIKVALLGVATKAATGWIKNAAFTGAARVDTEREPLADDVATINPRRKNI